MPVQVAYIDEVVAWKLSRRVTVLVERHPSLSVTVTVYVPAGLSVIVEVCSWSGCQSNVYVLAGNRLTHRLPPLPSSHSSNLETLAVARKPAVISATPLH